MCAGCSSRTPSRRCTLPRDSPTSMAIDLSRRRVVLSGAGALLSAGLPLPALSQQRLPALFGAWRAAGHDYAGVWSADAALRAVELPFRAHQVLADPSRSDSA